MDQLSDEIRFGQVPAGRKRESVLACHVTNDRVVKLDQDCDACRWPSDGNHLVRAERGRDNFD
jgi:hypothetical protein